MLRDDLDAIIALYRESSRYHAELDPERFRIVDEAVLRDELAAAESILTIFVAEQHRNRAVVGMVTGHLVPAPTQGIRRRGSAVRISDIVVSDRMRRAGIAGQLLVVIENWARDEGAASALLDVDSQNVAALELYRRNGYAVDSLSLEKDLGE